MVISLLNFTVLVLRLQIKNIMVDSHRIEVVREEGAVKYRGKINDTILNILGGVRSSCIMLVRLHLNN